MRIADLIIEAIESQPFAENTYVVRREGQSDCLIVDPGFEPQKILDYVDREKLSVAAILNTHGHSDHIAGNAAMKERWPDVPLIIGSGDAEKLTNPELNLSAPFGVSLVSPEADETVDEGDTLRYAGLELSVLDTPGHSAGHVVFVYKGDPVLVIGGDVLFRGSIGRTDFPDGSLRELTESIHQKLFTMPDTTVVLPGHGPDTTIGHEKSTNPFVGAPAGYGQ